MGDAKMRPVINTTSNRRRAQVAIEFTIALFCLFIFLVATAKMFVWFGSSIVQRHKAYEATRVDAGDHGTTSDEIDFYEPDKLDIFSDWDISDWEK